MTNPNSSISIPALRPFVDYSYGLAVQDMQLRTTGDEFMVALILRNCVDGPIRLKPEKIEFKMGGCISLAKDVEHRSMVIARGLTTVYPCPPMKSITAIPVPQLTGELEMSILYGHPDTPCQRRATWKLEVTIIKAQRGPEIYTNIIDWTDIEDLS